MPGPIAITLQAVRCRLWYSESGRARSLEANKINLAKHRDQLPVSRSVQAELPQQHENIRGPRNFH